MSLVLAPYHHGMRLGQGFNSFTQELRINDIVQKPGGVHATDADLRLVLDDPASTIEDSTILEAANGIVVRKKPQTQISQTIKWEARFVKQLSDVTRRMDVSGAHIIRVDALGAGTKSQGYFIDEVIFKQSDLNYLIHVEVINQKLVADGVTQFVPLRNVNPSRFTEVYGDSFVSGFLEGGNFNALISVNLNNSVSPEAFEQAIIGSFDPQDRSRNDNSNHPSASDLFRAHETSISVSWSGGGKIRPNDAKEWDMDTLMETAMNFPDAVAQVPQRISAIITKYTALRSFHEQAQRGLPLSYENAGFYAHSLLDAYTDYKVVIAQIQTRIAELDGNDSTLKERKPRDDLAELAASHKKSYEERHTAVAARRKLLASSTALAFVNVGSKQDSYLLEDPLPPNPLTPYKASIIGLERAINDARLEMTKIAKEVDLVTDFPNLINDSVRPQQYLSTSIFKLLLPTSTTEPSKPSEGLSQEERRELESKLAAAQRAIESADKLRESQMTNFMKEFESARIAHEIQISKLTQDGAGLKREIDEANKAHEAQLAKATQEMSEATKAHEEQVAKLTQDLNQANLEHDRLVLTNTNNLHQSEQAMLDKEKELNDAKEAIAKSAAEETKRVETILALTRARDAAAKAVPNYIIGIETQATRAASKLNFVAKSATFGFDIALYLNKELQAWCDGPAIQSGAPLTLDIDGTFENQSEPHEIKRIKVELELSRDANKVDIPVKWEQKDGKLEIQNPYALLLFPYDRSVLHDTTRKSLDEQFVRGLNFQLSPLVGDSVGVPYQEFNALATIKHYNAPKSLSFYFRDPTDATKGTFCGFSVDYNTMVDKQGVLDSTTVQTFDLEEYERIVFAELKGGKLSDATSPWRDLSNCSAAHFWTMKGRTFGFDCDPSNTNRVVWSGAAPINGYVLKGFWGARENVIHRMGLVWGADAHISDEPQVA